MDAAAFNRSLEALLAAGPRDRERLESCRRRISAELSAQLKEAGDLAAAGKREALHRRLQKIDARFGGLAAPRITELSTPL